MKEPTPFQKVKIVAKRQPATELLLHHRALPAATATLLESREVMRELSVRLRRPRRFELRLEELPKLTT
jgi:hypothetical protein